MTKESQPKPTPSTKDIWTLVKQAKDREKKSGENPDAPIESTLFFIGAKNSGKSSLILRFLDREETPTPAIGLEYTFGRRTRGVNAVKDVTHIWELAGGIFLSDLIAVPINESNIHTITFVIVFDLSDPSESMLNLLHLLEKIKTVTSAILDNLEKRGSKRPKALRAYAWKKFGAENVEKEFLTPSPVPILIIGTKYDVYRDMESEKRKHLTKTLRYLSHTHGASLIYTSTKDPSTMSKARAMLTHLTFKTPTPQKTLSVDPGKPVFVMAGQDAFSHIGAPPSESRGGEVVGGSKVTPWRVWRADFERYFPASEAKKETYTIDFSKFPEHAIDAMRAQKDEELEKLRQQNERKAKDPPSVVLSTRDSTTSRKRDRATRAVVAAQ